LSRSSHYPCQWSPLSRPPTPPLCVVVRINIINTPPASQVWDTLAEERPQAGQSKDPRVLRRCQIHIADHQPRFGGAFCCRTPWETLVGPLQRAPIFPIERALGRNTTRKNETAASTLRDVAVFEGMSRFGQRSTQQRRPQGAPNPETDDEQICLSWHCRCLVDCVRIAPSSSTQDA
jgi:hypothetical protein